MLDTRDVIEVELPAAVGMVPWHQVAESAAALRADVVAMGALQRAARHPDEVRRLVAGPASTPPSP